MAGVCKAEEKGKELISPQLGGFMIFLVFGVNSETNLARGMMDGPRLTEERLRHHLDSNQPMRERMCLTLMPLLGPFTREQPQTTERRTRRWKGHRGGLPRPDNGLGVPLALGMGAARTMEHVTRRRPSSNPTSTGP